MSAPDIREVDDFGVQRSEGSAFLNNDEESEVSGTEEEEEPQVDLSQEEQHRKVTEWCADNCVEYIESCGVDPEFDKGTLAAFLWENSSPLILCLPMAHGTCPSFPAPPISNFCVIVSAHDQLKREHLSAESFS